MKTLVGLFIPAVIVLAALIALGTWQLQRKAWKEQLIAALSERLAAPPSALPAPATWPALDRDDSEYRRVAFTGTFDDGKKALVYAAASAFRPDVSGPGYWVFTPARLAEGSVGSQRADPDYRNAPLARRTLMVLAQRRPGA